MKKTAKLGALFATAILAVGLSGCASQYTPAGTGGGVDCNWEGASR